MTKPWWSKKWGKDKICGITHARLRPGTNKNGTHHTTVLKCQHGFYTNPLLEWVKNCPTDIPTCPVCRIEFKLIDLIC